MYGREEDDREGGGILKKRGEGGVCFHMVKLLLEVW